MVVFEDGAWLRSETDAFAMSSSFCPSTDLITNRRYSLLRARPSSKTTMLATTSVPWRLEMS